MGGGGAGGGRGRVGRGPELLTGPVNMHTITKSLAQYVIFTRDVIPMAAVIGRSGMVLRISASQEAHDATAPANARKTLQANRGRRTDWAPGLSSIPHYTLYAQEVSMGATASAT